VRASRSVAQHFVAQSDGVIRESVLSVQIGRPLVHVDRFRHLLELQIQVADPIEQRQLVGKPGRSLEILYDLQVRLNGALELSLILELLGFELELLDVQGSPRVGNREMPKT